jgi:hypothetical protein
LVQAPQGKATTAGWRLLLAAQVSVVVVVPVQ